MLLMLICHVLSYRRCFCPDTEQCLAVLAHESETKEQLAFLAAKPVMFTIDVRAFQLNVHKLHSAIVTIGISIHSDLPRGGKRKSERFAAFVQSLLQVRNAFYSFAFKLRSYSIWRHLDVRQDRRPFFRPAIVESSLPQCIRITPVIPM